MKRIVTWMLVVAAVIGTVALASGCSSGPSAAEQKKVCFGHIAILDETMKLYSADTGQYPPLETVLAKVKYTCPSGGTYSFDANTGLVTCSVHGRPAQ